MLINFRDIDLCAKGRIYDAIVSNCVTITLHEEIHIDDALYSHTSLDSNLCFCLFSIQSGRLIFHIVKFIRLACIRMV